MLLTVISKLDLTSVLPKRSKGRNVNRDLMEMERTWNGVGENLDSTRIINNAKLTRT